MIFIFKKFLPLFTGLLIISTNILKLIYFEDFLFSLIWNSIVLTFVLILLGCASALMLIIKKQIYLFAIILLVLFSFELFNYSHKTLNTGYFSGSLFLRIEYLIALLFLFNFTALTAYVFSKKEFIYRNNISNLLISIFVVAFLLWFEYEFISSNFKLKTRQENEIQVLTQISNSFNDIDKEKFVKLEYFSINSYFDCKPCFENLLKFNNFVMENKEIFEKISMLGIIINNSNDDSVYVLERINKWKETYNIQIPIKFYWLKNYDEKFQNYVIVSDKNRKILFAGKWHPRIINILKKL